MVNLRLDVRFITFRKSKIINAHKISNFFKESIITIKKMALKTLLWYLQKLHWTYFFNPLPLFEYAHLLISSPLKSVLCFMAAPANLELFSIYLILKPYIETDSGGSFSKNKIKRESSCGFKSWQLRGFPTKQKKNPWDIYYKVRVLISVFWKALDEVKWWRYIWLRRT